jgi:hypothetical protein
VADYVTMQGPVQGWTFSAFKSAVTNLGASAGYAAYLTN